MKKEKMKAIRTYVDINYDITCKKLSDKDVLKLARKYLIALEASGNPRIAKSTAEELGITF